jgi:hypothetical protein
VRKAKSGEKYIYPVRNKASKWKVIVWDNKNKCNHYVGAYPDIDEAVQARDEYVNTSGKGSL